MTGVERPPTAPAEGRASPPRLERVRRALDARTDIGGSRRSIDDLRDPITVQLARMTNRPPGLDHTASVPTPTQRHRLQPHDRAVQRCLTLPTPQDADGVSRAPGVTSPDS